MEIIDAHAHLFRDIETGQKAMRDHSPTGYWGTMEELSDGEAVRLLHAMGPHKVLFASDFPWGSPVQDLKRIQRFGVADGDLEAILGGNARRVLRGAG